MFGRSSFQGQVRVVENDFKKIDNIGEGTYGKVFKAKDLSSKEVVALKLIKTKKAESDGMPTTALREIQLLKRMKGHPNIVNLKEIVGSIGSIHKFYLVFDYAENDIHQLLNRHRQMVDKGLQTQASCFTEPQVKCLMIQLLNAVKHLHDHDIIHRDLKSSNLLYNNEGQLKLADFGLARLQNTKYPHGSFKEGDDAGFMTPTVVTRYYRAPEILVGNRLYDGKAVDMWAVGCIFGELLLNDAIMPGKSDLKQIELVVKLLGPPSPDLWNQMVKTDPSLSRLRSSIKFSSLKEKFLNCFGDDPDNQKYGFDLIQRLLEYDPAKRLKVDEALRHPYFKSYPPQTSISNMPPFKSSHGEKSKRKRQSLYISDLEDTRSSSRPRL
mmetsp:Transcript_864/g.1352  ORF Transcript_864/g.1352 Transcript_864/m.1352 type:complete len:382 (-) Transcript_864:46-1191(-)